YIFVLHASLRRHPAPRVGHRPRVRAPHHLCLRVGGSRRQHPAHGADMERQHSHGRIKQMRKVPTPTPLNRALALGSSRKGAGEWWAERLSAIARVPLTIWFAASVIALTDSDRAACVSWLETPFATICMVLLLIALFHHTALG